MINPSELEPIFNPIVSLVLESGILFNEPRHDKANNLVFHSGPTQTELYCEAQKMAGGGKF